MAGRGPAPKDPSRRAGHTRDAHGLRVIEASPSAQPSLPEAVAIVSRNGREEFPLPDATRVWWQMWADSPLATEFTANDWSELLDTAIIHARFWLGEVKLAGELRLRVAKFGATPEDRARLRITFAQADQAEDRRPAPSGRVRKPLMPLRAAK
jgi:hypothetical protein